MLFKGESSYNQSNERLGPRRFGGADVFTPAGWCFDKGLDILVDAFSLLKKNHRLRNLKLRVAGGKTGNDELFIKRIRQQLVSSGLIDDVAQHARRLAEQGRKNVLEKFDIKQTAKGMLRIYQEVTRKAGQVGDLHGIKPDSVGLFHRR